MSSCRQVGNTQLYFEVPPWMLARDPKSIKALEPVVSPPDGELATQPDPEAVSQHWEETTV